MTNYDQILNPEHYVSGRSIQPINVIESWRLCHHLACLVKYIARLERKENTYHDLQKAEWYLKRELFGFQNRFSQCQLCLTKLKDYDSQDIAQDWGLSPDLEAILMHVRKAKKSHFPKIELTQALQHLQNEMQNYRKYI